MNTRRQIEVTQQTRKEIQAAFKCSKMALWRALNFDNDTSLSKRIRKFAFDKGGVLLCITPAFETVHDCDGFMRQYFISGAMLEADKNTGVVKVYDRSGRVQAEKISCTISELTELQEFANQLK